MYEYGITLKRVLDGDTVAVDIDLGFGVILADSKIRLAELNAPEMNTPAGRASALYLRDLLNVGAPLTLRSIRDRREKYGRYLGEIILADGRSANALMVSTGQAARKVYKLPRRPGR